MIDASPITRTAYFWRPVEALLYKEHWQPIIGAEQTERSLMGSIPLREGTGDAFNFKGVDYEFHEVGVHAWADTVADGVCLEIKETNRQETACYFIKRSTLLDKFPNRVGGSNVCTACLEPTARAIWLNAARAYIPASATVFCRRVPLEEHYGFQVIVWGQKSREVPIKAEIQRRACDPTALHVKLYGRFRAL